MRERHPAALTDSGNPHKNRQDKQRAGTQLRKLRLSLLPRQSHCRVPGQGGYQHVSALPAPACGKPLQYGDRTLPQRIIALDNDFCVQDLNPLALTMLGQERTEVIGMPLPMFFGESDFDKCREEGVPAVKKYFSSELDKSIEQTTLYIPEHR